MIRSKTRSTIAIAVPLVSWLVADAACLIWGARDALFAFALVASAALSLAFLAKGAWRTFMGNAAGVALVLAGLELYCHYRIPLAVTPHYQLVEDESRADAQDRREDPDRYVTSHPYLGYAPRKNLTTKAWLLKRGHLLYDVIYSIDGNGLRKHRSSHPTTDTAVLFFGCSYTFGEGVEDNETLPAYFEAYDPSHRKAINFGFHGYGPHQALAILEHQLEVPALEGRRPAYAIYWAIPDHVRRAAGRAAWDSAGPLFTAQSNGELHEASRSMRFLFHDAAITLQKSRFFGSVLDVTAFRTLPNLATAAEWDSYIAIVARAAHLFEERYHATFIALLSDDRGWMAPFDIAERLRERGVRIIVQHEIAPPLYSDPNLTIPLDWHPTAAAQRLVALGLTKRLAAD